MKPISAESSVFLPICLEGQGIDQALLATIPMLDFATEEGRTQIAQIPERLISSSHPTIPHDFRITVLIKMQSKPFRSKIQSNHTGAKKLAS